MSKPHVLLCTVGTGNVDQLKETLLDPLKKSILNGDWTRVILLPSQLTLENAAVLQREVSDVQIEITPLPTAGAEDDADACFAHFNTVLGELASQGTAPEAILVDFTRGTKAMSAALVLAALRHHVPQLRYVSGGQRDERGMVVPGTEIVSEVLTTNATAYQRLDNARHLFHHGNFAAVLEILPESDIPGENLWPDDAKVTAQFVRKLAAFCAAWDRLDYRAATLVSVPADTPPNSTWARFVPTTDVTNWVANLSQPLPDENRAKAHRLRWLVADLLANGERRLRDHQYEDAVIRGYRVLELIGQIRLFDHDLASDALPPDHETVRKFQEELSIDSKPMSKNGTRYQASREQVARLLKRLGDPLAKRLLKLGNKEEGQLKLAKRNYSVWIHGFEAIAGSDPAPLRVLLGELEKLIVEDGGAEAKERLRIARWPDFTRA